MAEIRFTFFYIRWKKLGGSESAFSTRPKGGSMILIFIGHCYHTATAAKMFRRRHIHQALVSVRFSPCPTIANARLTV